MKRTALGLILALILAISAAFEPAVDSARAQALTGEGDLAAAGAFTCDLTMPGTITTDSPEPVGAALERDRILMARRAGLLRKHIPLRIDPLTGNLQAGGRYLFDTAQHAREYDRFVRNYTLDGVKFLERPYFIEQECHAWATIGARDFADVHTAQVVFRTERWQVPAGNQHRRLREAWPTLRWQAAARGLTGVWLLYNQHERLVSLVYFANRLVPKDPTTPDFATLGALEAAPPLGDVLNDPRYVKIFDRTQWSWTIWFPTLAGDRGEPSLWPRSPPLPEPFAGDGVCEVSRGETFENASSDCAPGCGNGICQPGEDIGRCPGDCGLQQTGGRP